MTDPAYRYVIRLHDGITQACEGYLSGYDLRSGVVNVTRDPKDALSFPSDQAAHDCLSQPAPGSNARLPSRPLMRFVAEVLKLDEAEHL